MTQVLLAPLLVKLSALLGASLLVERFLYLMSNLLNRLFIFQYSFTKTNIEKMSQRMEAARRASEEEAIITSDATHLFDIREISPNPSLPATYQAESNFDLQLIVPLQHISSDDRRYELYKEENAIKKEFWMQLLGCLIAVVACYFSKFSIWIFITQATTGQALESIVPQPWEFVLTGIIIGAGSKPVNFLMNFLVNRKIEVQREKVTTEMKVESTPAPPEPTFPVPGVSISADLAPAVLEVQPISIEERIGFTYDGGDRPQRLENTHIFKRKVDLVVYHHTTMHSDAPFEELVREFDRKGWLTGYHCVVFKDGTIRVLCRWDRIGNHALPHNGHSLGIALQGNFEANPNIPFSNPDGSKGIMTPTNQQVESMSRITALWCLMHNIGMSFPSQIASDGVKGVIPHNLIAAKACPGSNFPHELYKTRITHYHAAWSADVSFTKALEVFKNSPMVMPK